MIEVRPLNSTDRSWLSKVVRKNWASDIVVSRGRIHDTRKLPGFVAVKDKEPVGELTYNNEHGEFEIVTINSLVENAGVGSALIQAAKEKAVEARCRRLWLITTNDNTQALHFYQKRGLHLVAVHVNALEESRKLKPSIPLTGRDGIPLRDEIELELVLTKAEHR